MQISIKNFQEALQNDRIDAGFFSPEYVKSNSAVESKKYELLCDIAHISDGNHLTIAENFISQPGVRYLRGQDLSTDMVLSDRNLVYINDSLFRQLKRSHIFKNDLLVTIVGANTGLVGLVYSPPEKLVASCKLGIVRPQSTILSGYLYSFLTSRYGQHQILRSIRGGGQTGLILPDLKKIKIARFLKTFEAYIHHIVYSGHERLNQSENILVQAEKILLSELGLLCWKPKHRLSFVRNFSDTKSADRIDAEYFQPMYDEVIEKVKQYKNGWSRLDDQFSQNRKSFHKINDHNYHYVEISCVRTSDGSIEPLVLSGRDLPANAKIKLQKNDIIISKVRPYRGAISIIQTDNLVGSSAFTVVQEKGTLFKETLFVLLRTKAYLKYSLKFNTGTTYPTIDDQDILGFPVPLIANAVQVSIKHKIEEAIRTKHQSQSLLDIAKRGVDLAIEENEQSAEKWIKRELDKLGVET